MSAERVGYGEWGGTFYHEEPYRTRTWTPESWEAEIAGCRADVSRWGHDAGDTPEGQGAHFRLAWHLSQVAGDPRPAARALTISSAVWAITFGLPSVY